MAIHLIKSNTLSHLMTPWRILPLYFATVKQRDWVFAQIFHRFGMISFIHIYQKMLFVWSRYLQKLHKTPIYRKSVWTLGCALVFNAEIFDIHHDFSIAHGPNDPPHLYTNWRSDRLQWLLPSWKLQGKRVSCEFVNQGTYKMKRSPVANT